MSLYVGGVTFIVGVDDGSEALLSCGVPDLHLDYFVIDGEGLEAEVDADGDHVVLVEVVVGEAEEQRGLAHGGVAHHHELKQMVVLLALHYQIIRYYYPHGPLNMENLLEKSLKNSIRSM